MIFSSYKSMFNFLLFFIVINSLNKILFGILKNIKSEFWISILRILHILYTQYNTFNAIVNLPIFNFKNRCGYHISKPVLKHPFHG